MTDIKKTIDPRWKDIQKGQVLFKLDRIVHANGFDRGRHILPVWSSHIVEDTTRDFYIVNGKKFRKVNEGNNGFDGRFSFAGDTLSVHVVPSEPTDPQVVSDFEYRLNIIEKASSTFRKVREIKDMNKAFQLAEKVILLTSEIEETFDSQQKN